MPKITDKPLEAVLIKLYKEDLDTLRKLYAGSFSTSKAIRNIVHTFVTQTTATANAKIDKQEQTKDDGLMSPMQAGESLIGDIH